jgi:hypothetical protein
MSVCKLKDLNDTSVKGTTLITVTDNPRDPAGDCVRPTIIYLPNKTVKPPLNVILWLHGFYVGDYTKNIFGMDTTNHTNKLRESADSAGQDVVLIAPWCEYQDMKTGYLSLGKLANDPSGVQNYLDKVLSLLPQQSGASTTALSTSNVERFVLACHSGGGRLMREISEVLGPGLGPKLKECWGFDCMYESGHEYACWADALPSRLGSDTSFYFYLAGGTIYGTRGPVWPNFVDFWRFAYGTPAKPEPQRMANVFLAPALNDPQRMENMSDNDIFQSYEAIADKERKIEASATDPKQPKQPPLSPYEEFRLKLDRAINVPKPKGMDDWGDQVSSKVKSHYGSVQDLLAPRIKGLFSKTKPASGTNIIAQIHSDRCKAEEKEYQARKKALEQAARKIKR